VSASALASHFNSWLHHPGIPALPSQLAVGWSGGADSTALLLALKFAGYDVVAWHVDHGWRASSSDEAKVLAERAAEWDIPFVTASVKAAVENNREAEARRGRFTQFLQWSQESGVTTLCLAHHADDQAETVCMRLLQGAGAGGCRGMQRERFFKGLRIVRPLLHVAGPELRRALQAGGFAWFEDPSNRDMSIWRNSIRFQLFPRLQQAGVEPVELFLRWQRQAERLTRQLDADADLLLNRDGSSELSSEGAALLWRPWAASSPAVRARVLQRMMVATMGAGKTPGRRHIELVEQWTSRSGRGGLDLSGCRLQRKRAYLHLLPTCSECAR